MRSCSHVFSVENKMPGCYWSRTGTADLSGALLHQKNGTVQCRSTLAVGETEIWDPSHHRYYSGGTFPRYNIYDHTD